MRKNKEKKPGIERTGHILRIILFVSGSLTIFLYFFSFIGILTGIGFMLFSRRNEWKAHGAVLSLGIASSTWLSNVNIELAPLKLAAIAGPAALVSYFTARYIINRLLKRKNPPKPLKKISSLRPRPWIARTALAIAIALPIFTWQSVSMDYGVLFDNSPRLLWVHAPTTVERGREFDVRVQCWDPYERLSAVYESTVTFELESYDLNTLEEIGKSDALTPLPYTFTGQERGSSVAYLINDGKDNGQKSFSMSIDTPGIHYIKVTDDVLGSTFYSNPVIVREESDNGPHIYWGDLHSHSILSDGSGSLFHNSLYARDIACLDFMGFTDHAEILLWKPGIFDYIEETVNQLNDPGNFIVFQGFEWTQVEDGHYIVILDGDRLLKNVSFLNTPEPYDLWDRLDAFTEETGAKALAIPHHSTKREYIQDWTYIDPEYVKLAEAASTHGNFLFEPWHELNYGKSINPPAEPQNGTSIMDALLMGHKLILYAAGDSHDGLPGHTRSHTDAYVGHQRPLTAWPARNDKPYAGGITAVFAETLSREDIFSSLEEGRVYASNDYGRPYLGFLVNGVNIIGNNELVLDTSCDARVLEITFAQDGAYDPLKFQEPIGSSGWTPDWNARIEILKNGELWYSEDVSAPVSSVRVIDEEPVTGAEYGIGKCIEKDGRYYINKYSDQPVDPYALNTGGADFYIIRTVSSRGREAYIGPFWIYAER